MNCPCCSGKTYEECCKRFHEGDLPEDALALMRSRYCAYALNLPEYIIATTHPGSPQYSENRFSWKRSITQFSRSTQFEKLEVLDFKENRNLATVVFVAHISQQGLDATFTEKSYFEKLRNKWFYRGGQLVEGHAPNLVTTGQLRVLPLAYYGDPILRKKALPISEITDDLKKLVEEMIETMEACNGMGLAAPQVHHSIRLFITKPPAQEKDEEQEPGNIYVFINPVILESSEDTWIHSEACLSIPTLQGKVKRSIEITVEYLDLEGNKHQEKLSGWPARVFQHEYDHIEGILFIDHLSKKESSALEPYLHKLQGRIHDGTEL